MVSGTYKRMRQGGFSHGHQQSTLIIDLKISAIGDELLGKYGWGLPRIFMTSSILRYTKDGLNTGPYAQHWIFAPPAHNPGVAFPLHAAVGIHCPVFPATLQPGYVQHCYSPKSVNLRVLLQQRQEERGELEGSLVVNNDDE